MKTGKYGYIGFVDKRKLKNDGWDDNIEPEIRKPTPAEREKIILNFIRDNSGRAIKIYEIAELLAVSNRTIQKILKKFEEQGLIKRLEQINARKNQSANIIKYIGPDTPRSRCDLTVEKLYDPDNPCGFRDWHWEEYKIIIGYFTDDFTKEDSEDLGLMLKKRKQNLLNKKEKFYKDQITDKPIK